MTRGGRIHFPDHAYVPGQTARHASGAFDRFKDGLHPGMGTDALVESLAWRAGLAFLREEYFWEAHEVLEPIWMLLPENGADRQFVQALIQYANAGLKMKMGRPQAAGRLIIQASAHFRAGRRSPIAARLKAEWPGVESFLNGFAGANPARMK